MRGIFSALLGAFDSKGRVDEQGIHALVRHNIGHCRVDGLYVNGSTGENFLLTTEAKKQIFSLVHAAARGEVSMIAQIGSNVLEECIELAEYTARLGYDAVSAVTPFYYKLSAAEIKGYYQKIASASPLPLIAYYIPSLTGVELEFTHIEEILRLPNVIGLKFTSSNFFLLEQLRSALPDKLIFSGYDEMLLSALALDVDGAIGSTYNVIGHWAKHLMQSFHMGDYTKARKIQHHINVVVSRILKAGLYQTLKEIAVLYNVPAGTCKAPMGPIAEIHREAAKDITAYMQAVENDLGCC